MNQPFSNSRFACHNRQVWLPVQLGGDLQKQADAATTEKGLCLCGPSAASAWCIKEREDLWLHRSVVWSDTYIQVVLQGLWSGCISGGEAKVVLKGVFASQKLLNSPPRVRQLASDGTEFLQGDSG